MPRVALFGAGRIDQVHARSVALHDEARLAWVIEPVLPAAKALADRYGPPPVPWAGSVRCGHCGLPAVTRSRRPARTWTPPAASSAT